jgi:transglutaminase-like putative cysteine protease
MRHSPSHSQSRAQSLSLLGVVGNTAALWIAVGVAGIAWWPIYGDFSLVILIAGAMIAGSAIAISAAVWRWPAFVVVPVTVAVFLLIGVPLAVPTEAIAGVLSSGQGIVDLTTGVALGWKQLLTISLPVGNYQALLVPCLVLALATVVVSLSLALRSRVGDLAALPPAVLLLSGLAFGSAVPFHPIEVGLAELAILLVWLAWRRTVRRTAALTALAGPASLGGRYRVTAVRSALSALLVLTIAGFVSAGAATALAPSEARVVLRQTIEQPFDPRDYASPLAGFRRYLKDTQPQNVLFTIAGLPQGQKIRIATLDTYDGIVYSVGSADVSSASGSFTRVPLRIERSTTTGSQASLTVIIGNYTGVWMPMVGDFESVDFSGTDAASLREQFYFNDVSGTGADVAGFTRGDQFALTTMVSRQPSEAQLTQATPGSASVPALGVVPAETSATLDRYTAGETAPGAKLSAMIAGLRADGYVSHGVTDAEPASRSGHSADRITQLFTDQRMIGDAEQYAVAAAIMARGLGFPSRVVFGFDPQSESGTVNVTGSMVSAWIEVDTAQFGWVSIDPNPPLREIPEEVPQDPTTVSRPPTVVQPPLDDATQPDSRTPAKSEGDDKATPDAWIGIVLGIARVVGSIAAVLLILCSPFLVVIAAKVRRRALRRTAPSALARISGGWHEFEDAAVDHGYAPPAAATRTEVAETVGSREGVRVAVDVDRAIFSPERPTTADADRMWAEVEQLTSALSVGRTRWQRLRALVSLRSFNPAGVRAMLSRRGGTR